MKTLRIFVIHYDFIAWLFLTMYNANPTCSHNLAVSVYVGLLTAMNMQNTLYNTEYRSFLVRTNSAKCLVYTQQRICVKQSGTNQTHYSTLIFV